MFSTAGKTALVTGGSAGIGMAIARALAHSGARVLIVSRKEAACREAAGSINAEKPAGRVEPLPGDVGTEQGILDIVASVGRAADRLAILVNNAGKTWGAPLESFPYKAWGEVINVNVAGPFALIQGLLPLLKAAATPGDPARVVNIGSMVGDRPVAESAYSYAASKAAMHHLTRILAYELAGQHVTVNAIAPGVFESRMTAFVTRDAERRKQTSSRIPMRRMGSDADIAGPIALLCGRAGSYITGAVLPVDGGLGILPPAELF